LTNSFFSAILVDTKWENDQMPEGQQAAAIWRLFSFLGG